MKFGLFSPDSSGIPRFFAWIQRIAGKSSFLRQAQDDKMEFIIIIKTFRLQRI
jgi:hypothetical protein